MKNYFGLILGLFVTCAAAQDYNLDSYIDLMSGSSDKEEKEETNNNTTLDDFTRDQLENRVRELERSLREYELNNEAPGWNGAGGGEFIVHRHNPWFLGRTPVKWCIDHGGDANFSLSKEKAKAYIERGFNAYLPSLKRISEVDFSEMGFDYNNHKREVCGLRKEDGEWKEACGYWGEEGKKEIQLINHSYQYVDDCSQADLEIILGNINNSKIQTLISSVGEKAFGNTAGTAIKTKFDPETLETKGFIYIAADKGPQSYKGARSNDYISKTIWNNHDLLPEGTSLPSYGGYRNSLFMYHPKLDKADLDFKKLTVSPFLSVITHELGHIFGFQHNDILGNLMHQDYPAQVIREGLQLEGDYQRNINVFERAILGHDHGGGSIEDWNDMLKGFEWTPAFMSDGDYFQLRHGGKISDFLNLGKGDDINGDARQRIMVFKKDRIHFYEVVHHPQTKELKYQEIRSLKYEATSVREDEEGEILSTVNFRMLGKTNPTQGLQYEPSTNSWSSQESPASTFTTQVDMYIFRKFYLRGKIFLSDDSNEFITYMIEYDYRKNSHLLSLRDPNPSGSEPEEFETVIVNSDIFSMLSKKLPKPTITSDGFY
jgi:hypothetical protein